MVRATGIPYATAGRFQPPASAPDWTGVLAATSLSPACPQGPVPFLDDILGTRYGELPGSEDCQRLSITMPAGLAGDERVPVMVWLHGGSYTSGSGDLAIFDPKALVAENRVIVVSVTYRLGLFGYLATGTGRPANLGLLDQLEAFRWVQRNIGAFGGDPGRVTAFGQSAGGDAVAHLMATPEAPSLFQRAIIQSAPLGITRGREKMSTAMGIAAETVSEDTPAMDVVEIEGRVSQVARKFGLIAAMPFGTQYGHAPLPPESGIEDAWNATAPGIEVLIGHTSDEARLFLPRNRDGQPPGQGPRARGRRRQSHQLGRDRGGLRQGRPEVRPPARAGGRHGLQLRAQLGGAGKHLRRRAHRRPAAAVRKQADLGRGGAARGCRRGKKSTPRAGPSAPSGPALPPGTAWTAAADCPAPCGTTRSEPMTV